MFKALIKDSYYTATARTSSRASLAEGAKSIKISVNYLDSGYLESVMAHLF